MKPDKKPSPAKVNKIKKAKAPDNLLDLFELFLPSDDAKYQQLIEENAARLYGVFRAALPDKKLPPWDQAPDELRVEFLISERGYSDQYGFHPEISALATPAEYAHNIELALEAKKQGHDFIAVDATILLRNFKDGEREVFAVAPVMSTLCKPTCKACREAAAEALQEAEHGESMPSDLPGVTLGSDRESLEMRVTSLERRLSMIQGGDYDADDFGKL